MLGWGTTSKVLKMLSDFYFLCHSRGNGHILYILLYSQMYTSNDLEDIEIEKTSVKQRRDRHVQTRLDRFAAIVDPKRGMPFMGNEPENQTAYLDGRKKLPGQWGNIVGNSYAFSNLDGPSSQFSSFFFAKQVYIRCLSLLFCWLIFHRRQLRSNNSPKGAFCRRRRCQASA